MTGEDGESVDEKVFVYVDANTASEYTEDCAEDEHDGLLYETIDAAFADILEEVFSDAKETVVEKLLD